MLFLVVRLFLLFTLSLAPLALAADEGKDNSSADIGKLEQQFFNKTYPSNSLEDRLSRLENFVFGIKNQGDAQARLKKLDGVFHFNNKAESSAATQAKAQPVKPEAPQSLIQVMNSGIDNYNLHRYHNAEDDFEQSCAMAPGMSRVHAYLAVTKMQINERQAAIEEFRTCYELDPFSTYGRYAKYCLLTLSGDEAVRSHGPVDPKAILDSTMVKIGQQTNEDIARHRTEGSNYARMRTTARGPFQFRPDNLVAATKANADAALRAAMTQESANNLKHLLATKNMHGDARLRAWGTTLNTRYYGNETRLLAPYYIPREYPQPLKAHALSIKKHGAKSHTAHAQHQLKSNKNRHKHKKSK